MTEDSNDEPAGLNLSSETLKGFIGQVLMAVTGFVGTLFFANYLKPETIGSFYLIVAIVDLLGRPIGGVVEAVKKRASEVGTLQDEVVGTQGIINGSWILVIALLATVFAGFLNDYIGTADAWWLVILLLSSQGLYDTFVSILEARGRIGLAVGLDTLRSFVTFPVQISLVLLGYSLYGMIIGLVLASLVAVPVAFRYHRIIPSMPSRKTVIRIWSFAKYSVPIAVFSKAYERLDTLLLGFLVVNSQVSIANYGIAARLTLPAMFLATTASNGLYVHVSNLESKGGEYVQDITNTLAFASIFAIPLMFGGAAITEPLLRTLFAGKYSGAAPFVVGIATYRIVQSQNTILGRVIAGLDRPNKTFRISVFALAINIPFGVALVYWVGAIGVVVATIFAELVTYLMYARIIRDDLPDVTLFSSPLIKQFFAGAVMYGIVEHARSFVPVHSWVDLSLLLSLGTGTYGLVLIAISPTVRVMIRTVVGYIGVDRFIANRI